jgi:Fe-S oxidoreductase
MTSQWSQHQFKLLTHCTEKTALPTSETQWQTIFNSFGLTLTPTLVGCCGMAGTYGHEAEQYENSVGIYALSWQNVIEATPPEHILATGYSCRSQVARLGNFKPKHPLQILAQHLQQ